MPLTPGGRLGPYEIVSPLGAGAMGEVYRARDTRLAREVAVKILPAELVGDADRRARLEREARTLASLNHPHIAHVYGVEESGSATLALVMELVEGDDLSRRLARGALRPAEAVRIARQIADGLQAAHAHHVIHRDLKPSNVKVRPDGVVKLLDFGIAKVAADGMAATAATIAEPSATEAGLVIGTAPYMSPEQASGQPVDKRTDIWAFGCVLYEMLTGRRAFAGETPAATIAAVLEREPDWTLLPPATPPSVRRLLRRCLAKERQRRLADIADAKLELDDVEIEEPPVRVRATGARTAWTHVAAALTGAAVAAAAWYALGTETDLPSPVVARSAVLLPPGERLISVARGLAISADGQRLAFATEQGWYVRSLDVEDSRRLAGVPGGSPLVNGVFSPDGTQLALISLGGIRVFDLATGGASLTPVPNVDRGGILGTLSWSHRGLLLPMGTSGIWLLPPGESIWRQVIQLNAGEASSSAELLPDGDHVLLTLLSVTPDEPVAATGSVVVQSGRTGRRTVIADVGHDARHLANGWIVYGRDGQLFGAPLDQRTMQLAATPIPLVAGVQAANIANATMHYAVSDTGTLIYAAGQIGSPAAALDLVITDRRGEVEYLRLPPAPYENPRVSPDGRYVAVSTADERDASVWIQELGGTSSLRRLTLAGRSRYPVWSHDSRRIAYQSTRDGDAAIFMQAADGSDAPTRLTTPEPGTSHTPESWSATHLLYSIAQGGTMRLWSLSLGDGRTEPFGGVESRTHTAAVFSPDRRWVAYNTLGPGGTHTVYVQPFPATGAIYQISRDDDGHHAVWSADGTELVFIPGPRQLAAVRMRLAPSFGFDPPVPLPPAGLMGPGTVRRNYDILPDGRFIGRQIAEDDATRAGLPARISLVTNWFEEMRSKAPAR